MSKQIKISKIKIDEDLFLRDNYDQDAIERYAEIYSTGGELPPLKVDKKTGKLLDGFHRRKALIKAEMNMATVELVETDDPMGEAIRSNAAYGVPLSMKERNRLIIHRYAKDNKTREEIADEFGLSYKRIAEILRVIETLDTKKAEIIKDLVANRKMEISVVALMFNMSEIDIKTLCENAVIADTHKTSLDSKRKLNDAEKGAVLTLCLNGEKTQQEIADMYQIDQSRISRYFSDYKDDLNNQFAVGWPLYLIIDESICPISKEQLCEILVSRNTHKMLIDMPRIIQGDLFDKLDLIPGGLVDAVVTDPPYYIMGDQDWDQFESLDVFIEWTKKWILAVIPKLKDTGRMFICLGQQWDREQTNLMHEIAEEMEDIEFKHKLIWVHWNNMEQIGGKSNWKRVWDPIYYFVKKDAGEIYVPKDGMSWDSGEKHGMGDFDVYEFAQPQTNFEDKKEHPAQKPLKMMKRAILNLTQEGDLVLDPFAGSGTTGIAAIQTGRNYVLIEKESKYVDMIKKRIQKEFDIEE